VNAPGMARDKLKESANRMFNTHTARRGGATLRRWATRGAVALGLLAIAGAAAGAVWWVTSPIDTFDEVVFEQSLESPRSPLRASMRMESELWI
jgi:hypothetical protein